MRLKRLKEELCAVVIMEAHSEESGRRSATIVIARVPASGKESIVMYSRMAKIAFKVSPVPSSWRGYKITGNDHSAATHDHESLHSVQICPAMLPASHDGPEKLPSENERKEPDRNGLTDQCPCGDILLAVVCVIRRDCHGIGDAFCETPSNGKKENDASES